MVGQVTPKDVVRALGREARNGQYGFNWDSEHWDGKEAGSKVIELEIGEQKFQVTVVEVEIVRG